MNPLPEICCTLAKYPDVALILDTVSSFSAVPIAMDALGIDVMLTGAQKRSPSAGFFPFQRFRKSICMRRKNKKIAVYYFDFLEFKKNSKANS